MISAIANQGLLRFRLFTGSFTGAVFIDFLRRLLRDCQGRKGAPDRGRPSGAPGQAGQRLGWAACRAHRAALPAWLQPGAQPGGAVEPRCQGQCRGPGGVPGRRASSARSCTGTCVVASASQRSWFASSITRRLGMPPPHESHHLPAAVIAVRGHPRDGPRVAATPRRAGGRGPAPDEAWCSAARSIASRWSSSAVAPSRSSARERASMPRARSLPRGRWSRPAARGPRGRARRLPCARPPRRARAAPGRRQRPRRGLR